MADTPNSADIPENEHLWRSLTQAKRDLQEIDHERQREIAVWLWRRNGLAKRFVEILTDFTVGEEPRPKAENEKLQEVLDGFWNDPVNDLAHFARELASQLWVMGEQFPAAFVRAADGRMRLGYIDPDQVGAVVHAKGNPRDLREVHLKTMPGAPVTMYRMVRPGEKLEDVAKVVGGGRGVELLPRSPEMPPVRNSAGQFARGRYDGLTFAFFLNRASNGSRGISDLFAEADYLDGLDKTTFNAVERSFILNTLAWDVLAEGVTDPLKLKEIEKKAKAAVSKPGGVWTHNEKAVLTPHTADLKAADMDALVKIVKLQIFGSWGFPLHWFADGGEANLATAGEMSGPTIRKLKSRQTLVRRMLRTFCDFQIELVEALAPERLSGVEDVTAYEITLPEIVGKDDSREATALVQFSQSIMAILDEGLIPSTDAALLLTNKIADVTGHEFGEEFRALLEKLKADDAAALEEEDPLEGRPGDDGGEPDEEGDDFEANQKKGLPPALRKVADAAEKGAG